MSARVDGPTRVQARKYIMSLHRRLLLGLAFVQRGLEKEVSSPSRVIRPLRLGDCSRAFLPLRLLRGRPPPATPRYQIQHRYRILSGVEALDKTLAAVAVKGRSVLFVEARFGAFAFVFVFEGLPRTVQPLLQAHFL